MTSVSRRRFVGGVGALVLGLVDDRRLWAQTTATPSVTVYKSPT